MDLCLNRIKRQYFETIKRFMDPSIKLSLTRSHARRWNLIKPIANGRAPLRSQLYIYNTRGCKMLVITTRRVLSDLSKILMRKLWFNRVIIISHCYFLICTDGEGKRSTLKTPFQLGVYETRIYVLNVLRAPWSLSIILLIIAREGRVSSVKGHSLDRI